MKPRDVLLASVLVTSSAAQINLSSLLSEAQSVYTVVTSALANQPTSTTSTSSSTTSSSSSSTTTSSSTSSSSASPSTSASSASTTSTPTTSAAASTTTASTGNGGGGGGSNTLPIVLGCTLGALALAAFLALIFLCRRRSRKSKLAAKRRDLNNSDDESDVWNRDEHHRNSFKGPTERTRSLGTTKNTAAAPLMSQHGYDNQHSIYGPNNSHAYNPTHQPTTQFGSVSNGQENDSTAYSAHPYSPDHVQPYGHNPDTVLSDPHRGNNLAAGAGGAALGGLAAHTADHHEARRSDSRSRHANGPAGTYTEAEHNNLPEVIAESDNRRSGSVSRASAKEPWPFMDAQDRRSNDSTRSRQRSFSRGRDQLSVHEQAPRDNHSTSSGAALAGAAAAGGLAGAAATYGTGNRSPHRKGILKQTNYNPANASTFSNGNVARGQNTTHNSGPHELESFEVPPPLRTNRERRHSPLGTAAPTAAIGANRSPTRSSRRSWSNSSTPTNVRPTSRPNDSSQDSDIPSVPSRSPRRNSLHSNARYSTANEGTVELPVRENGQARPTNRELVSPNLEPHRYSMDNDGLVSPVSPDTSLPGTWSRSQAEELSMNPAGLAANSSSQESTAVGYSPLNSNSSSSASSRENSSGLVSAIQRIFNSQKQSWPVEDSPTVAAPRRSFGDRTLPVSENVYDDEADRVSRVPHRKPAPARMAEHKNQYDETANNNNTINSTNMSGGWANETAPLQQTESRKSMDSSRSNPANGGRFYAHVSNASETDRPVATAAVPTTVPTTSAGMNTGRTRSTSRPGYGIGSGDPFDLARIRTDSSMTGITLSDHTEPTKNTTINTSNNANATIPNVTGNPYPHKSPHSSHDYREPTLAELKREVEEEDRQRRMSWKSTGRRSNTSRKSTEGQRYGNDKELFDLAFPGSQQYDHFYGQGQGQQQHHPGTATGVGTAY